jgi:hypothetical protein
VVVQPNREAGTTLPSESMTGIRHQVARGILDLDVIVGTACAQLQRERL